MTNNLLGKIFYGISIISIVLTIVSFIWFIAPDPLPIVVDDVVALQACGGFFLTFISTFIAGSCLCKDGCASEFIDGMIKTNALEMINFEGNRLE